MTNRSKILSVVAAVGALAGSNANAAELRNYTPASFAAAQQAGRSILVEIHASWCSTCRVQDPILSRLETQSKFQRLVVFRVDFDAQKAAVRGLGAQQQSTLIAYKNGLETARSVGDTNPASLAALLDQAL